MASWTIPVDQWCNGALARVDIVGRKIALEAFKRVILRSPVDTGRFRGNWQATIGAPAIGELGKQHNSKLGSAPIARATSMAMAWKATTGQSILLTNNLPYALALEHGHSKQAPGGMVAITAAEFGGIAEEGARP